MIYFPRRTEILLFIVPALLACLLTACTAGSSLDEPAFILPERLRLRSSTAQASRFVTELKGGVQVTITGRATSDEGVPWVKIIGPGGEVGWAEERYFVSKDAVDKARKIEEEIRGIQTQAVGRSKATLRLRLTPDRSSDANTGTTLPAGTVLEIVARKRVPKPESAAGGALKYDDWLQVRLRDFAVLPAGWIYGGSVELEIPSDIYYFNSSGRRITGWLKIATVRGDDGRSGDHYLVMERRTSGGDDLADFDRIKVLAYQPGSREYTVPFQQDINGVFPVALKMNGSNGEFRFTSIGPGDKSQSLKYGIELPERGKVKVVKP